MNTREREALFPNSRLMVPEANATVESALPAGGRVHLLVRSRPILRSTLQPTRSLYRPVLPSQAPGACGGKTYGCFARSRLIGGVEERFPPACPAVDFDLAGGCINLGCLFYPWA